MKTREFTDENGYEYKVELIYSNVFYGQKTQFKIKTNNPKYGVNTIIRLMHELYHFPKMSETDRKYLLDKNPNDMALALKSYCKCNYNEDTDDYTYMVITPYDD